MKSYYFRYMHFKFWVSAKNYFEAKLLWDCVLQDFWDGLITLG